MRPLLPAAPRCLVLITSRDRLGGLIARDGARSLGLGVLPPAEARSLLVKIAREHGMTVEPADADRLARAHLIQERAAGLFTMHDLFRRYADDLSRAEDSAAAPAPEPAVQLMLRAGPSHWNRPATTPS